MRERLPITSLEMSSSNMSMRAWEWVAASTWLAGCTLRGEEAEEEEAGEQEKGMGLWLLRAFPGELYINELESRWQSQRDEARFTSESRSGQIWNRQNAIRTSSFRFSRFGIGHWTVRRLTKLPSRNGQQSVRTQMTRTEHSISWNNSCTVQFIRSFLIVLMNSLNCTSLTLIQYTCISPCLPVTRIYTASCRYHNDDLHHVVALPLYQLHNPPDW